LYRPVEGWYHVCSVWTAFVEYWRSTGATREGALWPVLAGTAAQPESNANADKRKGLIPAIRNIVQLQLSLLDSIDFCFRACATSFDFQHTLQLFQRNALRFRREEKDRDNLQNIISAKNANGFA
jgi:hypothetical protein